MVAYRNGIFLEEPNPFRYQDALDAVQFDDFGVYKDLNETQVYIRDRLLNRYLTSITMGPGIRLNFRVQ